MNLSDSEQEVIEQLQRQPHLLMQLAENAFNVATNLRDNYFHNTARFIAALRDFNKPDGTSQRRSILHVEPADGLSWADCKGELVTFIDGGVGTAQIASQVPILLRVGSYAVRPGDHNIRTRESFGYYPIVLGDLEGGSREKKDFIDIVRITAELLGGLAALERTPDLRVLMFHGPLVYLVGNYAGHTPFTESDIDLLLKHYGQSEQAGKSLKEEFLTEARIHIYPKLSNSSAKWISQRVFEPLSWMAFLYRKLLTCAKSRSPLPIIAGVVERGALREFTQDILLERLFRHLRLIGQDTFIADMFGRPELTSEQAFVDALGYSDGLLLAMLMQPGQVAEPWMVKKYAGLRSGNLSLVGSSSKEVVDFSSLASGERGFPPISASYVQVLPNAEPIRVETFAELEKQSPNEASKRAYLYARLLPGYGFPVGLDIADKHAHVPNWLTVAYSKLIRHHLGVSLQRGDVNDQEMRRILVQAIYMTNRDFLFRPQS